MWSGPIDGPPGSVEGRQEGFFRPHDARQSLNPDRDALDVLHKHGVRVLARVLDLGQEFCGRHARRMPLGRRELIEAVGVKVLARRVDRPAAGMRRLKAHEEAPPADLFAFVPRAPVYGFSTESHLSAAFPIRLE